MTTWHIWDGKGDYDDPPKGLCGQGDEIIKGGWIHCVVGNLDDKIIEPTREDCDACILLHFSKQEKRHK